MFTSDAKNRWAANWVQWPGFDRLWANIFRDLLPHAPQSETTADFDRASDELVVDYRLSRNVEEPATMPDIFVFGPNGFHAPLKVSKVAAGHYRGRLAIGQNQGLFRVRPLVESRAFPEVGFYRQEDEMQEYGNNEQLLRQIAASTGGRFGVETGRRVRSGGPQHSDDHGIVAGPAGAGAAAEPGRTDPAQVEGPAGGAAPHTGGSVVSREPVTAAALS